jgi:hypothetical protein
MLMGLLCTIPRLLVDAPLNAVVLYLLVPIALL